VDYVSVDMRRAERVNRQVDEVYTSPGARRSAETWETFDQPLGEDGERMRQGFRFHLTDSDGHVHFVIARSKLPEDVDLDP
jgi:hypothetical protein